MKLIFTIFLLLPIITLTAQSDEEINLLETDATWRKETLHFPFPFAKQLTLEGDIDVRFTHGWSDIESPYFWSYAFGWSVNQKELFTVGEIEENMELYLGGLMKAVNRDKSFVVPSTVALFSKIDNSNEKSTYHGKIKFHDSFFSKKMITLHVRGEQFFCTTDQKLKFFCKLSPKEFPDEVWNHLEKAQWQKGACGINSK